VKAIRGKLILLLLVILFLGLFLRIYNLGNESIWLDEATSIKFANLNLFKIVEETSQNDTHPPLYYIVLHYWINLFGDSEFSTRFPSVIFGFLAIFMIYKIGSLIFDKEAGILSSLILALSVFHIHYSQEVRMYSLMTLLTLLSMYFFIRLLKERSFIVSVCYLLSSILLIYTHSYGLFIIIAQNIYILTLFLLSEDVYRLSFKRWIFMQFILVGLFTPWMIILIKQILRVESGLQLTWVQVPSIRSIKSTIFTYSGSALLFLCFLILSPFSMITYEKIRGSIDWKNLFKSIETYKWNIGLLNANRIYLLLVWLLTPIILPFIVSQVSAPIYSSRFTIGASLPFYLLVARGIENIDYKYLKLSIISIIIVGSLVNAWEYYTEVHKEQWRDVAGYIGTNTERGDLLLFNPGFIQRPFDYYSKRTDIHKKAFPEKTRDVDKENIKQLKPSVEGYNRVWLILAYSKDDKGMIKKTLSESYNLSYYKEYVTKNDGPGGGSGVCCIEVYLFEKK
jgi:mannosyltransferase